MSWIARVGLATLLMLSAANNVIGGQAYRLESSNDETMCSFSLDTASLENTAHSALMAVAKQQIYGATVADGGKFAFKDLGSGRATFQHAIRLGKPVRGESLWAPGLVSVSGVIFVAANRIYVTVKSNSRGIPGLDFDAKLIACTATEVADRANLPLAQRIALLQEEEKVRLRSLEKTLGDVIDKATGQVMKLIAGEAGPIGKAFKPLIGKFVAQQVDNRHSAVDFRAPTPLELHNQNQIEAREYCNAYLGAGTCY